MNTVLLQGTRRFARLAFLIVAVAFAAGVIIQIFIAGLAVFVDPGYWGAHVNFVDFLMPMPILMLLLALVGRLPGSTQWQSATLGGLIFVQHVTANSAGALPWAAAAHPVTAMVLFWMSARNVTSGWRLAFEPDLKSDQEQLEVTAPAHTSIVEADRQALCRSLIKEGEKVITPCFQKRKNDSHEQADQPIS